MGSPWPARVLEPGVAGLNLSTQHVQGPGLARLLAGPLRQALDSFVDSFLIQERTCAEWEETKSDQDCGVKVPAAGWLGQACGAGLEGTEAKRTAVAAGLAGESQQKHVRPSS